MTLNFDTTRAPLGAGRLAELVAAVRDAEPTDESLWLEWKGQLDLSTAAGRSSIARCIVGFANRVLVFVRWMATYVAQGRGERVLVRPLAVEPSPTQSGDE